MNSPAERLNEHMTAPYDDEVDVDEQVALREAGHDQAHGREIGTVTRFVVDDESKADWALRKLAKACAARQEIEAAAEAERQRIDNWCETEAGQLEREEAFFSDLLTDYHRSVFASDPKAKSIKRPFGTLKSRQNPDRWEFDEDAFIEWASAQERFTRTKVEIDRATAKKALKPKGGKVLDPETGEIVPGVDVIPGERTFTIEVAE